MDTPTYEQLASEALERWPGKVSPQRMADAVTLVRAMHCVLPAVAMAGTYIVRSARTNTHFYNVDPRKHTCNCPDGQYGHVCKHRLAVWLYVEMNNRTTAAAMESGRRLAQRAGG